MGIGQVSSIERCVSGYGYKDIDTRTSALHIATMPALLQDPTPHIPAWRKLGLKLKYAKDLYDMSDVGSKDFVQNTKKDVAKRKREDAEEAGFLDGNVDFTASTSKKPKNLRGRPVEKPDATSNDTFSVSISVQDSSPTVPKKDVDVVVATGPTFHESKKHKKSRKSQPTRSPTPPETTTTKTILGPASSQIETGAAHPLTATPNRKRKSVSFTPETKTGDGDSVKQIYKSWLAIQRASDPTFRAEAAGEALRFVQPPQLSLNDADKILPKSSDSLKAALQKQSTKPKAKIKAKVKSTAPSEGQIHIHPALAYLTTHYTSPTTWKFSKKREVYLLKHLFSLTEVPSSYNPALQNYLGGLKSTGARKRTRDEALEIVKADEELEFSRTEGKEGFENEMENPERKKEYYDQALQHLKRQLKDGERVREQEEEDLDPELRRRYVKRKRAEVVLWSLGDDEDNSLPTTQSTNPKASVSKAIEATSKAPPLNNEPPSKKPKLTAKRKRKLRTGVPDDDDISSSSSSSSSDSEDDADDLGTSRAKAEVEDEDETSSSGSGHSSTEDGTSSGSEGKSESSYSGTEASEDSE